MSENKMLLTVNTLDEVNFCLTGPGKALLDAWILPIGMEYDVKVRQDGAYRFVYDIQSVIAFMQQGYTAEKPHFKPKEVRRMLQQAMESTHNPRVLVIDIETDSLSVITANVKVTGMYSYVTDKTYCSDNLNEVQMMIDSHSHLVGFNLRDFDNPILTNGRNNIDLTGKVIVDYLKALKARGRKDTMDIHTDDNKLATIVEHLKLGEKMELDYNLLRKSSWTKEERELIDVYTKNDILITKKLHDWWIAFCEPFKSYVSYESQWRMNYATCSIASYAYKTICNTCGLKEEYADDIDPDSEETFEGGFVAADVQEAKGNIVSMDFASLYPTNMYSANLFCPVTPGYSGPVWDGGTFYPDLKGRYKKDKRGLIEETILKFYKLRKEYKKQKDPRQYTLKIVLNSLYGAASNKVFKSVYNETLGPDCTYIGRQNIKFVRETFQNHGFKLIYTDTDSCFVQIPEGKTIDDLNHVRLDIMAEIKRNLPFPDDEFNLAIENRIKYFQSFIKKGTKDELKKKLYLYLTEEDKLIVKGMPVVRGDSTVITQNVFERLKPEIIKRLDCKFPHSFIDSIIKEEIDKDITVLGKHFRVKDPKDYKTKTDIRSLIADKYGAGNYLMIKNKVIGIGKGVKYCTVEEAKKLHYNQLDLTSVYSELEYFIKTVTLESSTHD